MIIHDTYIQKETCSGCMACAKECPVGCISHTTDEEGFMYPKVNLSMCIDCNNCVDICPFTHPEKHKLKPIACYAAWSQDNKTREDSATAGGFMSLAQDFISNGGVVYGASYMDDLSVSHIRVDTLEGLPRLQGSKYLQSDFSKIYYMISKDLEQNKKILVCSTPCQIAGIKAAFNYENITLIDILCLGVPSPLVFGKYIKSVEKKNGKKVKDINFRDKSTGWKTYSQTINFGDDTKLTCSSHNSPYMRGFLDKIYIRPSCAKCPFSDTSRVGDITIGDYWGIENSHPEFDNEKGVSILYANSDQGKAMLNSCKQIEIHEVKKKDTLQQALQKPATLSDKRSDFFNSLKTDDFDKLAKKYMKQRSRIVQLAINMLKY